MDVVSPNTTVTETWTMRNTCDSGCGLCCQGCGTYELTGSQWSLTLYSSNVILWSSKFVWELWELTNFFISRPKIGPGLYELQVMPNNLPKVVTLLYY